jgi:diaminopimelate epimerase
MVRRRGPHPNSGRADRSSAYPEGVTLRALKGHGTGNDFVVLPDLDGALDLSPALVRALCDRHTGIGADGVLRVVRSEHAPESVAMAGIAPFFMDYRNADGSLAQMCGNGIRVMVRYLVSAGLVSKDAAVATRGGIVRAQTCDDGSVLVAMGAAQIQAERAVVTAVNEKAGHSALCLDVPNPHAVVILDQLEDLRALDLSVAPLVEPSRPDGQNVEFVVRTGPRALQMRVHERGVGETQSCGTGICAAVVAVASGEGQPSGDDRPWTVDVPGGRCEVTWHVDGTLELRGPAVLVAEFELTDEWLAAAVSRW